MKKIAWLFYCVAGSIMIGSLGSVYNFDSLGSWYQQLTKPSLTPPGWLFGPVWTLLFILLGVSLYLVIVEWYKNKKSKHKIFQIAMLVFILQWFFNILWSFLFFYLRFPLLALVDIVILWLLIIYNVYYFYKIRPWAGYLLIPYLLWVSFASYLNFMIYKLNY
jgi:tryptophan-rich sensory protein